MTRPGVLLMLLIVLGWGLPRPLSAATSQSFQVSATVVAGCLVVGGGTNYGRLSFGRTSALATSTVRVALTGAVQLQCTPGVTLNMTVDGGQYNYSGRHLQVTGGGARIAYSLFLDAAYSQSLGVGQSVAVTYNDPNNIRLPIYGQVRLPGDQPDGTYSDVLQVLLSW